MSTNRIRYGIGALGVLAALYGAFLVLSRQEGFARLESVAVWMVGGVVLHDFVLAPVVLGLAWIARGTPTTWRRPAIVALVVVGSLSLLAVPVLVGPGRADNPTLLDRPYGWSWVVLALVTVVLVVAAGVIGSRRRPGGSPVVTSGVSEGGEDGEGARGR